MTWSETRRKCKDLRDVFYFCLIVMSFLENQTDLIEMVLYNRIIIVLITLDFYKEGSAVD